MKKIFHLRIIISILAISSVTSTESDGVRRSFQNLESLKNGNEPPTFPNDSKTPNVEDLGLSSNKNTNRNSPALDSFLKNILQARNELKWIDKAVRRFGGTKEAPEKAPSRYLRSPSSRYKVKNRFKRRSNPRSEDDESWTSFNNKRRYYDYERPERVYLDDEMKVKRDANPVGEFYEEGYGMSGRKQSRSALDDVQPLDDSTLRHWAKEEGLTVPGGWFEADQGVEKIEETPGDRWSGNENGDDRGEIEGLNRMDDFDKSVDDRREDSRDEREARDSWVKKSGEKRSLESLKKTVLELRRSLEESDKKMNAIGGKEGDFKYRDRHPQDVPWGERSRGKTEHGKIKHRFIKADKNGRNVKPDFNSLRDPGSNLYGETERGDRDERVSSNMETSSGNNDGSNWWEDPRSAVDLLDFKKREDDTEEEDDEEDGNSDFDYMMRRVKREKGENDGDDDDDEAGGGKRLRFYRRSGFGELYPDEKTYDENFVGISKTGRVYGEIREAGVKDKINDGSNSDGVKKGVKNSADINVNENGHSVLKAVGEIKKSDDYNPLEKSGLLKSPEKIGEGVGEKVSGAIGDSNLYETKNAGFISADEKGSSSSSLRSRGERQERGFSIGEKITGLGEESVAEKIGGEKETRNTEMEEGKEVEKSEPNDDDVHKLSKDSKKDKNDENRESNNGETANDYAVNLGEKKSDENKAGMKIENETIKTREAELGVDNSVDKIIDKIRVKVESENGDKPRPGEPGKLDGRLESEDSVNRDKVNREGKEGGSKTVEVVEPGMSDVEMKNTSEEDLKGGEDENKSKVQGGGEVREIEKAEKFRDEKQQNSGAFQSDEKIEGEKDRQDLNAKVKKTVLKREDLPRKLLWVSEEMEKESRDQKRPASIFLNAKTAQGFENRGDGVKFVKRSLMVARDDSFDDRDGSIELEKSSVDSYAENVDEDEDEDEDPETGSRKGSAEKIVERQRGEDVYENEDDGVSQDDDNESKDSDVKNNEGEENEPVFSHRNVDQDPMRGRINMLIKEKLDERGKGKLTHFKREVNLPIRNIEYYDYESEAKGDESEADSRIVESDHRMAESNNSTCSQDKSLETVTKKDENAEEERKEESEQEEGKRKPPKEEFISDVELAKIGTKKPPSNETTAGLESSEKSYHQFNDEGIRNNLHNTEASDDLNDGQTARSNNHWLAQPLEVDSGQENGSVDREGRYRGVGEPEEEELRSLETGKVDIPGEPLEYSVNVRGKLEPESIDAVLKEKEIEKENELGDDEKRKDRKSRFETNGDFKYEGTRGRAEGRIDDVDEYQRGEKYGEISSGDFARIEEGTNDRTALENHFSHNGKNRDEIIREKRRLYRDTTSSEKLDRDPLPSMLDRGEPGSLVTGEKTYLVIEPVQVQCRREFNEQNLSSSSGSNYLALKVTDDMFKGGIEQSNPIEDSIADDNVMGKTTTEWKVMKMGDNNAGNKPGLERNVSSREEEADLDLKRDDDLKSLKNLGINPRDVVHESIVDPEEMIGDLDDDTKPIFGRDLKCVRKSDRRFGRSLQSVSYPIDPSLGDWMNGEKPVDKYLENTQTGFMESGKSGHRMNKRNAFYDQKEAENFGKIDGNTPSGGGSKANSTKNLEKRSSELKTPPNPGIDKNKRGLTNVEEWETNAPTVQKQRMISAIESMGKPSGYRGENGLMNEEKNLRFESTSETSFPNFYDSLTSGYHERESRSVKLRDREDAKSGNKIKSWKPREKMKKKRYDKFGSSNSLSRSKPFVRYDVSSLDSDPRYYYDGLKSESVENLANGYNEDWKKLNPEETGERKHRGSKNDEYEWKLNRGSGKSAKEEESKNRHYRYRALENHRDKAFGSKGRGAARGNREFRGDPRGSEAQLKSTEGGGHRERSFKEYEERPVMQRPKSHNKIAADVTGHSHNLRQSKSFQDTEGVYDPGRGSEGGKKVLEENAEDPMVIPKPPDAAQGKKFTVLLAADNMEDESQMDLALHGELAGKIVERIFDQVQKNNGLKLALGPGLYRKHKSEDAVATDKIYRQGLDEDEVKHTEGMMRRVMELLGRLILDEVQRKTCASLPPDMREFLQWMLGVEEEDRATDQEPPLPLVHNEEPNHRQDDKFLFQYSPTHNETSDVNELSKKVRLLKSLINEYNALSDKEKTQVQTVHDYLVRQLGIFLEYIEAKESEITKTPKIGGTGAGNILQYQNAVPDINESRVSESTFSPLVNTPSILMLSNASFVEQPRSSNHLVRLRLRETRSPEEEVEENHSRKDKKHKNHKRPNSEEHGRRKHNKHKHKKKKKKKKNNKKKSKKNGKNHQHQKHKGGQTPEYKKLIQRAAMLRKKRADIYGDDWNPVDSGYEEPTIYTTSGQVTDKGKRSVSSSRSLQPWLSPKSEDFVPLDYLKELSNELVHGSLVAPVYTVGKFEGEEKRDVGRSRRDDRNLANDEVMLLSKREAWKASNEQQLEEVAFGKDMRGKWREKEEFAKLTEMDKKKNTDDGVNRKKRNGDERSSVVEDRFDSTVVKNSDKETGGGSVKNTGDENETLKNPLKLDPAKKEVPTPGNATLDSSSLEKFKNSTMEGAESVLDKENEMKKDEEAGAGLRETDDKDKSDERMEKGGRSFGKMEFSESVKRGENLEGVKSEKRRSDDSESEFKNRKNEISSPLATADIEGSAILPLLEISEQIEQQKQAGKTEKDDQRDIADQILGLESSPMIAILNTY